jgi:putative hydrolase of the HAD superfamily
MTARPAIAAVIFDFGGVVVDMRWDVAAGLEQVHGLPRGALVETLYRTPTWREIERGRGDLAAWRDEAHRRLEACAGASLPRLHDAWLAARHPIRANLAVARRLRPGYRTAILSNADVTLRARLHALGLHHLFDAIVSSAEEGLAKPEPAIFLLAAERVGARPEACVFVDDYEVNVRAAEAVGMRGVLYRVDRGEDLAARLAALGVRLA